MAIGSSASVRIVKRGKFHSLRKLSVQSDAVLCTYVHSYGAGYVTPAGLYTCLGLPVLTLTWDHHHPPVVRASNNGFDNAGSTPKERPDRSKTIERTIASRRPGSTCASWKISRSRSSEWGLTRHRATERPGRFAGISCNRSQSFKKSP